MGQTQTTTRSTGSSRRMTSNRTRILAGPSPLMQPATEHKEHLVASPTRNDGGSITVRAARRGVRPPPAQMRGRCRLRFEDDFTGVCVLRRRRTVARAQVRAPNRGTGSRLTSCTRGSPRTTRCRWRRRSRTASSPGRALVRGMPGLTPVRAQGAGAVGACYRSLGVGVRFWRRRGGATR